MCLGIKPGCKIEIADKDIPVFKYINKYGIFRRRWGSTIMKTKERRKYNIPIKACDNLVAIRLYHSNSNIINEGFHSYVLDRYFDKPNAVIPKGSEYCFGTIGEIVSNQIIVFSSKRRLKEYLSRG